MASEKSIPIYFDFFLPQVENKLKGLETDETKNVNLLKRGPSERLKFFKSELPIDVRELETLVSLFGFSTPGFPIQIATESNRGGFFAFMFNDYEPLSSVHQGFATMAVESGKDGVSRINLAGTLSNRIIAASYKQSEIDGNYYLAGCDIGIPDSKAGDTSLGIKSTSDLGGFNIESAGFITQAMVDLTKNARRFRFKSVGAESPNDFKRFLTDEAGFINPGIPFRLQKRK